MTRITHIVPRFYPEIDGVGDFARQLAEELAQRVSVESRFVVAGGMADRSANVSVLANHDPSSLAHELNRIDSEWIFLHYSGYGFHERGVPQWLCEGLERHLPLGRARLAVFFHEIWASGPPWKSEFYLQRSQKNLVVCLNSLADACFTSTPRMQRLLRERGRAPLLLPIPSPLPPTGIERDIQPRSGARLTVFGQEHSRARTLKAHRNLITALARANRLEQLSILGKNARISEATMAPEVLAKMVILPNANTPAVIDCLSATDALLSYYPANLLTKSSAAMAAFSCGCPVILPNAQAEDQFAPPPPYLTCNGSTAQIAQLLDSRSRGAWADTGRRAQQWYQAHASWDRVLPRFVSALKLAATPNLIEAAA